MDYLMADPDDPRSDVLIYAAGHKALGLYALLALRNEVTRAFNLNFCRPTFGVNCASKIYWAFAGIQPRKHRYSANITPKL